jgi:Ca2+-binding RTX toxin-like protein
VGRGLLVLTIVGATLLGATSASATTVGYRLAVPTTLDVVADPGETNTIVWLTNPAGSLMVTDATAPIRIAGEFPAQCRKVLRIALCSDATGYIELGDGADKFTAPLSNDNGIDFTTNYHPQFTVFGGAGNDRVLSSLQNDSDIYGGPGNDLIVQGSANTVHGDSGNDTIVLLSPHIRSFGYYSLSCGDGVDTIALPQTIPTPADCERRISLPDAVSQIPSVLHALEYLP